MLLTSTAILLVAQAQSTAKPLVQLEKKPGVYLRQELRNLRKQKDFEAGSVIVTTAAPKTIALTFDDGPHNLLTAKLLKMLGELDVKATFFVVGKMVDKYPELVRQEIAEGHEVANHTYDHLDLSLLSPASIAYEYRDCSEAIFRATGIRPQFCRPPGGRFDGDVVKVAAEQGLTTVLWTNDPGDYARPDTKVLLERIERQLKNGGILLLHDGILQTMHILPKLVKDLRERGFQFVTCSEILEQKAVARKAAAAAKRAEEGTGKVSIVTNRRRPMKRG